MSGGNVTILQFTSATTAPVAADLIAGWQTTASQTVSFTAAQMAQSVYATSVALTNQTTATAATAGAVTLATGAAGYLLVSINGTPVKLPYYTV